jgi:hypothetical protein
VFVNPGCCIQLNEGPADSGGPHWYCDAIACDFQSRTVFLCEVSFAKRLDDLIRRLTSWHQNWGALRAALRRDNHLLDWPVRPWLFVPTDRVPQLVERLARIASSGSVRHFEPGITTLEMVQPWMYEAWGRRGEAAKPDVIPLAMQT